MCQQVCVFLPTKNSIKQNCPLKANIYSDMNLLTQSCCTLRTIKHIFNGNIFNVLLQSL